MAKGAVRVEADGGILCGLHIVYIVGIVWQSVKGVIEG